MDTKTLRIVLWVFIAILVFNFIVITRADSKEVVASLTNANLPIIGVVALIIGRLNKGNGDDKSDE